MDPIKTYALPILLAVFIIFRRIKRAIGFQKYNHSMFIFRIVVFSIIAFLLLINGLSNPIAYLGDSVGIIVGFGLAYYAIKDTVIEKRTDAIYYRSHIWIELIILLIFFGRIIYRFYLMYTIIENQQSHEQTREALQNIKDPITSGAFFIACSYYIVYFALLLKKSDNEAKSIS
jgi:hypothetical protein